MWERSRRRRESGGGLYFHQLSDSAQELLRRGGYFQELGPGQVFETKGEAIAAIFERLDRGVCVRCDRRIFNECRTLPRVEVEMEGAEEEIVIEAAEPAE